MKSLMLVMKFGVQKAKPSAAKGRYVHTVYLCSTMGPGVQIDLVSLEAK